MWLERPAAERLRAAVVDACTDLVGICALDGRVLYINPAGRRLLGLAPEFDVTALAIEDFHPPDLAEEARAHVVDVPAADAWSGTFAFRHFVTGETIRISGSAFAIRDANGTAIAVANISRDLRPESDCTDIEDRIRRESLQRSALEREVYAVARLRLVGKLGRRLASTLERDDVLHAAVTTLVPDVADWVLLELLDDAGAPRLAAAHHRDPLEAAQLRALVGTSSHRPDADATFIRTKLATAGVTHGTMTFGYGRSRRRYVEEDDEFFEEVARRVSMALDNAERYERERRVALRLQETMLPATLPAVPGFAFDAFYRAGSAEALLGGDWYDAFETDDGRVVVCVGDVMGSGLEAAATMSAMREAIRGVAEVLSDPVAILDAADRALTKHQTERLVTAFVGVVDAAGDTLLYASAGHPPPLLRGRDGSLTRLLCQGLPLGLREEVRRESAAETVLGVGDVLVLHTDGLTEIERDVEAGEAVLRQIVEQLPDAPRNAEYIAREVFARVAAEAPHDDVAVLTMRCIPLEPRVSRTFHFDTQHGRAASRVRRIIMRSLAVSGFPPETALDAELAVGELLANAARYASGRVEVELRFTDEGASVWVRDRGPGLAAIVPKIAKDEDESGRGIYIAARLATHLEFEGRPGGGSAVRLDLRR